MINPLAADAWRGLAQVGPGQNIYLNCLFIQAIVLFLWWPKAATFGPLSNETRPATLFALFITIGITSAYYAIQSGAEEGRVPGQHSLDVWVMNSPLRLWQILFGHCIAGIIQSLHLIVLSSPLIIMANAVNGAAGYGLFWSLTAIVIQAYFYRLIGAIVYRSIGHRVQLAFVTIRAALLGGYVLLGIMIPLTSHWQLTHELLRADSSSEMVRTLGILPGFLLGYAMLTLAAISLLWLILRHQRRNANWSASVTGFAATGPAVDIAANKK